MGPLSAPLPPDLPPSPPPSRSNSPALPPPKRKHDPTQDFESTKRQRIANLPDAPSQHPHHYHHPQPPSLHRSSNQPTNFNLRSEPSEDGEVREDLGSIPPRTAGSSALSSFVPVRRPRRGKAQLDPDAIHQKYHLAGRLLKFSGDARFWSTYPSSHKEYRPLSHPPPPNSQYHKFGALIARLELVDALVCFTYSLWIRDYARKACYRETWVTIEAFLSWCKNKWTTEDTFGEREKALLGLM